MNAVEIIEDVISNIQNCAAGEVDVAALESVLAEIAALSAKPETAKLPEVEDWLKLHAMPKRHDNGVTTNQYREADIKDYLQGITAAHAVELASCNRGAQLLSNQMDSMREQHDAALIEAEAKGRREALQSVPVESLRWAIRALNYEALGMACDATRNSMLIRIAELTALFESARAAQQEETK